MPSFLFEKNEWEFIDISKIWVIRDRLSYNYFLYIFFIINYSVSRRTAPRFLAGSSKDSKSIIYTELEDFQNNFIEYLEKWKIKAKEANISAHKFSAIKEATKKSMKRTLSLS